MIMRESVALLRRYRYDPKFDFGLVRVVYENRGAPKSRSTVEGGRITKLANTYFEMEGEGETVVIPYHRIIEIEYSGRVEWKRVVK
jgi:uncharacterized protein (UPF0248 family)